MNNQNNEKFILDDFLSTEKHMTSTYNMWLTECVNPNLRNKFMDILKDSHCIQNEVFQEMNARGFYPVKPSTQQELDTLKQKFC